MRGSLLALLLALPLPASAVIFDGPDFARIFSRVVSADDDSTTCTAVAGVGLRCSNGTVSNTVRAGGATCLDGSTVTANVPCVTASGLEGFPSGIGGRTAADVHTISTAGWPTERGEICITATLEALVSWNTLLRGSTTLRLEVRSNGSVEVNGLTPSSLQLPAPPVEIGVPHTYCVGRSNGEVYLKRDGVKLGSGVRDALNWGGTAELGRTTNFSGTISRLTWSAR